MRACLLIVLFLGPAPPALAAKAKPKASRQEIKFVESFLRTPIAKLPTNRIDDFMSVDPQTLPARLRRPYAARRLELQTCKQLAEGKKKGPILMSSKDCAIPKEAKSDSARILKMAGFEEIQEDEEQYLIHRTSCSERDMMCDYSLQIIITRDKQGRPARRRYFLYPNDPLMALVAEYRSHGRVGGNTNFFGGKMGVLCTH
ncbi:MAG: hypothetical protein KGK30_04820 [Elusimicrobia bacterium]|nr:hypothetical protein [Elusimicrobiota bacterium]